MAGIDTTRTFQPLNIAVLTVSDTRTAADDTSGDLLAERITGAGHSVADRQLCRDDVAAIQQQVRAWVADPGVDAVVATGGTGLTGRDVTPEAFQPLYDKEIDGFSVVFHLVSHGTVGISTLQSRATAGIAGGTVLFALPGSNGAVKDGWDQIIQYELDSRYRPCNLVDIMPRFTEQ